jgi:hypothetical protein
MPRATPNGLMRVDLELETEIVLALDAKAADWKVTRPQAASRVLAGALRLKLLPRRKPGRPKKANNGHG